MLLGTCIEIHSHTHPIQNTLMNILYLILTVMDDTLNTLFTYILLICILINLLHSLAPYILSYTKHNYTHAVPILSRSFNNSIIILKPISLNVFTAP